MPTVIFHKNGERHTGEVADNTNLVVCAGVRRYPFPHLKFKCGMGKCTTCACRVLAGAEHLTPPNAKEIERLGPRLAAGYRLMCQIWLTHDIELAQDAPAPRT